MLPIVLTKIEPFKDGHGNEIVCDQSFTENIRLNFRGSRNRLVIKPGARIARLNIEFDCDDGYVEIGSNNNVPKFIGFIRVGEQCRVLIGDNVSMSDRCVMTVAERSSITIGNDVMIATAVEIRADDAHPIFDIDTGKRLNMPKGVHIGDHVWLAGRAVLLSGTVIGSGSVVGFGSIVKGKFPNNCIIAGVPAKVVKKNIAWERPHLSIHKPGYKPDASFIEKSDYWHRTEDFPIQLTTQRTGLSLQRLVDILKGRLAAAVARSAK